MISIWKGKVLKLTIYDSDKKNVRLRCEKYDFDMQMYDFDMNIHDFDMKIYNSDMKMYDFDMKIKKQWIWEWMIFDT